MTVENIKKLGIVAGGGKLPLLLQEHCNAQGIKPFVIGFDGFTDQVTPDYWARMGRNKKTLKWLKSHNIADICLIGSVKRPTLFDIWPDFVTAKILIRSWIKSFGDDALLRCIRNEIEKQGIRLHAVQKFMPDLLMPEGVLGNTQPTQKQDTDNKAGLMSARQLGALDIGQAVIIKGNELIAGEDKRGTNAMIERYGQAGTVLVKCCKPQQDRDMDLPTIGVETVKACIKKGMVGIAAHAGHMLIVNRDECQKLADEAGFFIKGYDI